MNYIVELNAFYASLLTRPLSSEAQALWGVLMHLFNRAGWRRIMNCSYYMAKVWINLLITLWINRDWHW